MVAAADHADQMAAEVYATRCARRIAAVRALKIEGKYGIAGQPRERYESAICGSRPLHVVTQIWIGNPGYKR
jgi:hypothetical protein